MAVTRWAAWIFAIGLIVGTILSLGVSNDVFVTPPTFPPNADLPTRLLGSIDFDHAVWPFDLVSSLSLAIGFGALLVLAWSMAAGVPQDDRRRSIMISTLAGAAILGLGSQLVHIGATQVAINVGYCDCGFKEQEAISKAWALMLIGGAQSWLVDGAVLLLAVGMEASAALFAGTLMSRDWRLLTHVIALVIVIAVAVSASGLSDAASQVLTGVAGGILIPIWAIWLSRSVAGPGRVPEPVAT
jgi:hypothetical protein